jgi:hypothetical protein
MEYTVESFNTQTLLSYLESNGLILLVCALFLAKLLTAGISFGIPHTGLLAAIDPSGLEQMVNQTRVAEGLTQLKDNADLDKAAQLKADDMIQNQYFAHTSPTGITPWYWFTKSGYSYQYAGENLAIGFYDSTDVYQAWLNSPEHLANIVNPHYQDVGTAVVTGYEGGNTTVVVQLFGSEAATIPAKEKPTVSPVAKSAPVAVTKVQAAPKETKVPTTSQPTVTPVSPTIPNVSIQASPVFPKVSTAKSLDTLDKSLQAMLYGISLLVMGMLLTILFFGRRQNVVLQRSAVIRIVIIAGMLSASLLIPNHPIIL